jgi:protein-L-isoaspartate(D-aspartate) O-methyltransferase
MDKQTELSIVRQAYAKQILAAAGVNDARIESAFAAVRREDFLGPGPWEIVRWPLGGYVRTPSADPVYLYTDELVGIIPERQINNGQPSFHAALIKQIAPAEGEHVVHVGAGAGYYSAIFAELVGKGGRVTAIEYLPEIAARAKDNLRGYSNVEVLQGDGAVTPFREANVIYVNAGATRPADIWLDQLAEGGRLILPLTTDKGFSDTFDKITSGVVFRIQRRGDAYLANWVSSVAIFPCAGSRDEESELALGIALGKGGEQKVTRLYRHDPSPENRCWLRAPGWCLAYS